MNRMVLKILLSLFIALYLSGCMDMYDQPSFKPQEGPRVTAPEGSVPTRGVEILLSEEELENPYPETRQSLEPGAELYEINCSMCHGNKGMGDGLVGKVMDPQPPSLQEEYVQEYSDPEIFLIITEGYGRMPPFQKRLLPEERWHVINFVRWLTGDK